jgi:Bacterial mobilisation protein (MobC)
MWLMAAAQFLKTRIALEEKQRVHALASELLITESVWLKRLVMRALGESAASLPDAIADQSEPERLPRDARLYVRLCPEDRLLLRERATARGMAPATYVSVLMRAHLRGLAPLPKEELTALKRSVAELGAIGRNLNQIARAVNHAERAALPGPGHVGTMLRIAEGLRDHFKGLLKANERSWTGHRDP